MKEMWKERKIEVINPHTDIPNVQLSYFALERFDWKLVGVWQQESNKQYHICMFRQFIGQNNDQIQFFLIQRNSEDDQLWCQIELGPLSRLKIDIEAVHKLHHEAIDKLRRNNNFHQSRIGSLDSKLEESKGEIERIKMERNATLITLEQMEHESSARQKTARDAQEEISELHRKIEENYRYFILSALIGGLVLLASVIIVIVLTKRGNRIMSKYKAVERTLDAINKQRAKSSVTIVKAGRVRVNEHPAVRDVFGMKEVFDVTPKEGKDLVRIARPLETAGAERKLSEELMDIQPVIVGPEGNSNTTGGGTTSGETMR